MAPLTKLLCVEYFSNVKCTTEEQVRFNLLPQTKVVHGAVFGARPKQQDAELTVSALFLLKKRKVVSPRSALLSA
jgi:hypothetical protein